MSGYCLRMYIPLGQLNRTEFVAECGTGLILFALLDKPQVNVFLNYFVKAVLNPYTIGLFVKELVLPVYSPEKLE